MTELGAHLFAASILGAGSVLTARGLGALRARRRLRAIPASSIGSLILGLAEIQGELVPASDQLAPFSGRRCAYWEVDIATRAPRGGWRVVHRNSSGNPFFLRDESGIALVYPHGSECRLASHLTETCAGIGIPSSFAEYMEPRSLMFPHVWRRSVLRFRERVLVEGQRLHLLGTAIPRAVASGVVELAATGTDGPLDLRLRTLQESTHAVFRRVESQPLLIISDRPQRQQVAAVAPREWGTAIAGPLVTALGVGYWLAHVVAARGIP
jgi:hypothetical protein